MAATLAATLAATALPARRHSRESKYCAGVQLKRACEIALLIFWFLHKYNSLIENHILNWVIKRHGYNVENLLGRKIIQSSGKTPHLYSFRHK